METLDIIVTQKDYEDSTKIFWDILHGPVATAVLRVLEENGLHFSYVVVGSDTVVHSPDMEATVLIGTITPTVRAIDTYRLAEGLTSEIKYKLNLTKPFTNGKDSTGRL